MHLADLADAQVFLARHFGTKSCANRTLLGTVKCESTAGGSSYDNPGDEDLVQLD